MRGPGDLCGLGIGKRHWVLHRCFYCDSTIDAGFIFTPLFAPPYSLLQIPFGVSLRGVSIDA